MNETAHQSIASIEATAAQWLAQRDAGRWTADDEAALQSWLTETTAHRVEWLRLQAAWQRADQMQALPLTADDVLTNTSATPPVQPSWPPRRSVKHWAWASATVLAVVAASVMGLIGFGEREPAGEERYSTSVGGQAAVTLADGSRVTLNTRTRARSVVNDHERKVWLDEGEAFFEVQHDPSRPFVVTAGLDRITVLGTKFSVRYEAGRTKVTVLEGRVQLDGPDVVGAADTKVAATPVVIKPNATAVSQAGAVLVMAKSPEQVQQDLSWRQGKLVFDSMTLGEIAAEFNRYNRKQMVVEGDAAAVRFGGSFDSQNVEGFARLVHEAFALKMSADKEVIRLSSN
jgi:transmembrane sensor